jgi:hypothetical protein
MRWLLLCGLVALSFAALAQSHRAGGGARAAGQANVALTLGDAWALFNNVGALAWHQQPSALFAYDNRFAVNGLQVVKAGATSPLRWGAVGGLGVSRFGDALLNETVATLGLGHRIGNYSVGLGLNYVQISLQGLGTASRLALEFGGAAQLTPQLWLGAHVYNFNQARLANFQDERLPTLMRAGLSYRPNARLLLSAEAHRDLDYPTSVRAGLEYHVLDQLALRTGAASQPFSQSFGVGWRFWAWQVDYALATHPQLPLSHFLSLTYQFRRLRKKSPNPTAE